ncbi:hypothetical protein GGR88_000610 [Sphingomonas jejuensis]|uniref:Uncharacterized protein n=1 Tax=Sphingomonas jejuensis TaxID=904715 RepID=A0ABX0XK13_9SPHN|nr:hypothetical protein [Sphingomonas jejuensis]NJC33136.1 hypothetical protein [Sphingomonas jejuensis]
MASRSADDFAHERGTLDAAYAQNETGRDSFVALAHTALFASSVAFVGDVTPLKDAVWRPALILGWIASVLGLLALTFSFGAARRAIDARRRALNDDDPPSSPVLDILNAISLWSFPVSLLCLFSFVTANVVSADEPSSKPPASAQPTIPAVAPQRGCQPPAASANTCACPTPAAAQPTPSVDRHAGDVASTTRAEPHRPGRARPGGRHAGTARPDSDAATTTSSAPAGEEVTGGRPREDRCF